MPAVKVIVHVPPLGAMLLQPELVAVTPLPTKSVPVKLAATFNAASVVDSFVIIIVPELVPLFNKVNGELLTLIGACAALFTAICAGADVVFVPIISTPVNCTAVPFCIGVKAKLQVKDPPAGIVAQALASWVTCVANVPVKTA